MITTRGEGNMKMEQRDLKLLALKTGVTQEQAKGRQHPLEAERARPVSSPEPLEGALPCWHLGFSPLKLFQTSAL